MKSLTAVCQTGALMPAINPNGRIARHTPHRGDGDDAEMKMYLSKLKDLVPYVPKNRKLSKLEIIQHVIDYICELQSTLETHADIGSFDAAGALSLNAAVAVAAAASASAQQQQNADGEEDVRDDEFNDMDETHEEHSALSDRLAGDAMRQHHQQQQQQQHSSPAKRHPLVDRKAPNTILPATAANAGPAQHLHQPTPTQQSLSQLPLASTATPHSTQTQSIDKDSWSRQTC